MPKVKKLKKLKKGYVRANAITDVKTTRERTTSAQIKIGGKRYKKLVNSRKTEGRKRFTSARYRNQTKAFDVTLPRLYKSDKFKTINTLMKRKHIFSESDKERTFDILSDIQEQDNKMIKFNLKDDTTEYISLKGSGIEAITNALASGYFGEEKYAFGSDTFNTIFQTGIKSAELTDVKARQRLFNNGRFFNYLNTTDINLEKYQIITKESNKDILIEHCLAYALKHCDVCVELINRIKSMFNSETHFQKKYLYQVSEIIEKQIILSWYDAKDKKRMTKYGDYKESVNIALFENHYFINDKTIYTKYASINYSDIKHIDNHNDIFKKDVHNNIYKKNKKTVRVDALTLIRSLFAKGHFVKDKYVIQTKQEVSNTFKDTLDLINDEQIEFKYKHKTNDKKRIIIYADIECDVSGTTHKPILFRFTKTGDSIDEGITIERDIDDNDNDFYKKCMNRVFSKTLPYQQVIIYFHNLKYDYSTLKKQIQIFLSVCKKGGNIYSIQFLHNKKKLEMRDTSKFASFPLSKFQETFELDNDLKKKEGIAYRYYTTENMNVKKLNVKEYEKFLNDDEKKIFRSNLENNNEFRYRQDKKTNEWVFNPINYYKYYLKYDTYILMKGMEKFEQMINNLVLELNEKYNYNYKFDIHNYLTISSLTHDIVCAYGAYDGVYNICGNLRDFCSESAHGGRVQVNEEYRTIVIDEKVSNLDAKSLYPSAIKRLCDEKGLPMGKCKRIDTYEKKTLDNYDYYIVKVQITSINKKQQLPIVRKRNKLANEYINDIDKPLITYIDMITLEDWINFCDIEYDILDGVYWNDGYNKRMGDIVEYLFDKRSEYSQNENKAMANIIKLMLVSIYGKTITQKILKGNVIVDNERKDDYLANNFNNVESCKQLNDRQWIFTMDKIDNSYNMAHIGSFILSYSKRIMNEVYDIANNNNCVLYYSDTDSIHCNYDDIKTIETEYKKLYNQTFIGNGLGQFHNDFKLDGAVSEIYSVKSLFIDPKTYIDNIVSKDIDGKQITKYHFRIKGITKEGVEHYANKNFNGDIFKVYEELSTGKQIDFVMNPKGKDCFEYSNNGVSTKKTGKYIRTVGF